MLPRDGKWHEIEFPYSDLAAQGLVWDGEQMGKNFMSLVSEQAENGAVLDFDAIYFYSTGDKEDSVAQLPAAHNVDIRRHDAPHYGSLTHRGLQRDGSDGRQHRGTRDFNRRLAARTLHCPSR